MTEKLSEDRLREIVTFDDDEWSDIDGIPSLAEDVAMASELLELRAERELLRAALEQIAAGDGYYGAMAREYKEIARVALGSNHLAGVGNMVDAEAERGAAVTVKEYLTVQDEAAIRADERAACAAIARAELGTWRQPASVRNVLDAIEARGR